MCSIKQIVQNERAKESRISVVSASSTFWSSLTCGFVLEHSSEENKYALYFHAVDVLMV